MVILPEPGDVHHAAHVKHQNHLPEGGADLPHHVLLSIGEIVVPPGEDSHCPFGHLQLVRPGVVGLLIQDRLPVPALPGEPAEDNHRHVRLFSGGIHQVLGQLRFGHQAGHVPGLVPLGHIVPVEIGQGLIQGHPLPLQAVVQVSGVGHGHISAAAAPLHIVEAALAEQGHPGLRGQGEQSPVVFQQDSPLPGCLPGQGDMFPAGRHRLLPLQGQIGLIAGANPLFHHFLLEKAPSNRRRFVI